MKVSALIWDLQMTLRDFGDIYVCMADEKILEEPRYFGVAKFGLDEGETDWMAYLSTTSLEPPILKLVK